MNINTSVVDLLKISQEITARWINRLESNRSEYGGITVTDAEVRELYADMRAASTGTDYVAAIASDPFMDV